LVADHHRATHYSEIMYWNTSTISTSLLRIFYAKLRFG